MTQEGQDRTYVPQKAEKEPMIFDGFNANELVDSFKNILNMGHYDTVNETTRFFLDRWLQY